jgi:hypothetical protein
MYRYIGEKGFEFKYRPIENTINIKETPEGWEARYLVHDDGMDVDNPACESEAIFLVHYHRDFNVEHDNWIKKDEVRQIYAGEKTGHEKKYWLFPVSAYIHSGVCLRLGKTSFEFDPGGWDTSHVGLLLVSRQEWKTEAKARAAAQSHIDNWNAILSGEVYGLVVERYDKAKKQISENSCWGFVGTDYALKELEDFNG